MTLWRDTAALDFNIFPSDTIATRIPSFPSCFHKRGRLAVLLTPLGVACAC